MHFRLFDSFCILLLLAAAGCSRNGSSDASVLSRHLARASQAMSEGAHLGSLAVANSMYAEREPHPKAYVGSLLFERYCDPCHGASRKAPNITKNRATHADAESDYYIIRYGINDMPGFRSKLTVFQIYDILAHLNDDMGPFLEKQRKGGDNAH